MEYPMYIVLNQVKFHAYHGVGEQERVVWNEFTIDLKLQAGFSRALLTDRVEDTVSYAGIYQVLKEEMATPSRLLEHVCGRILRRFFTEFPAVSRITIRLTKRNPPMGADLYSAGVEITLSREEWSQLN
ncbi:MAG: dihydroneopterin aldolase [Bacteroides sp.]|nr:dihydroneopterin aldolase [Bacteroides sp.]